MIALGMDLKAASGGVIDRALLAGKLEQGDLKALARFGAFVRRRARSSIRKRRAISRPGDPPSSHVGRYKALIFFAVDRGKRSVVIGPVRWGKGQAGRLLEKGGTAERHGRRVTYRPRPVMGPAFAKEKERVSEVWRDSIK